MKHPIPAVQNVIISRTDSIGDVILTLPLAKLLKDRYPQLKVAFMGKAYTRPVIDCCAYVDTFIDVADFLSQPVLIDGKAPESIIHVFPVKEIAVRAKALKIKERIGTTNRLYHWFTCNRLIKLSRKNSDLHEAQLNARLLQPFDIDEIFSLDTLGHAIGLLNTQALQPAYHDLTDRRKFNLILHPRSQGSAREWGIENFVQLITLLPQDRYKIFISGTTKERASLDELFEQVGDLVTDICGLMDLSQFVAFIKTCDGLVANSTGPLHIAAALGKKAVGIYPPLRPMHPGRWKPLGPAASFLVSEATCNYCRKQPALCHCMKDIKPETVLTRLQA